MSPGMSPQKTLKNPGHNYSLNCPPGMSPRNYLIIQDIIILWNVPRNVPPVRMSYGVFFHFCCPETITIQDMNMILIMQRLQLIWVLSPEYWACVHTSPKLQNSHELGTFAKITVILGKTTFLSKSNSKKSTLRSYASTNL